MAITESEKNPIVIEDNVLANDPFNKGEDFVTKNSKFIAIALGVVLLAVAGYFFYKYQMDEKNKEAQAEMFGSVYYFEADSLNKALNGDGKDLGFLNISEDYSGTKAGNLSNFYIGVIYLKNGKFEDAKEYLKKFSSDDLLLQARAYCLIGDANLELKDTEGAIEYYKKASSYHPNEFFTPRYLMKLALAHELNKEFDNAVEDYNKIINDYYKSAEASDAKKLRAFAEEKVSK